VLCHGALFLFALLKVDASVYESGSMESLPLQYQGVWLTDEFSSRRDENSEYASLLTNLIALTFLNAVILTIEVMWVSTSCREIVFQLEHTAGIISEPAATSYSFVHD